MAIARVEKLRQAVEAIEHRGINPLSVSAWPVIALVTMEDFNLAFSGRKAIRERLGDCWRWSGTLDGFEWAAYEGINFDKPVEMEVT